jgi:hypothetical protein
MATIQAAPKSSRTIFWGQLGWAHLTEIFLGLADSVLGNVTVKTPSLNSAAASPSFTAQGKGRLRLKLPKRRSMR